jgi:hypothetical protein
LGFHDIHILYREHSEHQSISEVPDARGKSGIDGDGRRAGNLVPYALIVGENGELDQEAILSISHDKDYATATCLGFVPTPDDAAFTTESLVDEQEALTIIPAGEASTRDSPYAAAVETKTRDHGSI